MARKALTANTILIDEIGVVPHGVDVHTVHTCRRRRGSWMLVVFHNLRLLYVFLESEKEKNESMLSGLARWCSLLFMGRVELG